MRNIVLEGSGRSSSEAIWNRFCNRIALIHREIIDFKASKGPWRRGGDSNPRYPCEYAAFRVRCIQPLCHLSAVVVGPSPARRTHSHSTPSGQGDSASKFEDRPASSAARTERSRRRSPAVFAAILTPAPFSCLNRREIPRRVQHSEPLTGTPMRRRGDDRADPGSQHPAARCAPGCFSALASGLEPGIADTTSRSSPAGKEEDECSNRCRNALARS